MEPEVSVVMAGRDRLQYLRRVLHALAVRPPSVPFEVVYADDDSSEDLLSLFRHYSSRLLWKFVRLDRGAFTRATGIDIFWNNPAWSYNVAFRHSRGRKIFLQGNDTIAWQGAYDALLAESAKLPPEAHLLYTTTYDVRRELLEVLDPYGTNLSQAMVDSCVQWPLHSEHYRSDVVNYLSLMPRALWERLGGFDERYLSGISGEDSDFVRRARALPGGCPTVITKALALHQNHGGKTRYQEPSPKVISRERFAEGCAINRALYDAWGGRPENPQPWAWGTLGVGEVVSNVR